VVDFERNNNVENREPTTRGREILFDLISIFIIFQYVFGLDEFSKRMLSKLFTSGAVTAYPCGTPVFTPGF
jgi:hypothetical protein